MSAIMRWETFIINFKVGVKKELCLVSHASKLATFAAISHWTLSLTAALYNTLLSHWASQILPLTLIDRHWLSLHCSDKQRRWTRAHQSQLGLNRASRTLILDSSSIFPLPVLLAGWVTSWQSCWPCVRKFTAWCNHLLCSKHIMFELLHLLQRAALYCKCAISIHEGIYMHSQATLLVFIPHIAHSKSYGILQSYDGSL